MTFGHDTRHVVQNRRSTKPWSPSISCSSSHSSPHSSSLLSTPGGWPGTTGLDDPTFAATAQAPVHAVAPGSDFAPSCCSWAQVQRVLPEPVRALARRLLELLTREANLAEKIDIDKTSWFPDPVLQVVAGNQVKLRKQVRKLIGLQL